ncbi:MAG: hypothetical protein ACREPQ_01005 [Rhodanobacter sp.]
MSDFSYGMLVADSNHAMAHRRSAAALAETHGTAVDWINYARQLESKLQAQTQALHEAKGGQVVSHGLADGRLEVVRLLKDALKESNPNHPLLQRGMTAGIEQDMASAYAESQGWLFNKETYGVRRVR